MDRRDGDRRRRRQGVFLDSDVQLYFNAVIANGGALSDTEQNGYEVYRIDSKDNANPWNSDAHADYPMMGGTIESMAINAQSPGTFDLTFVNTVAGDFTANGFTPNGVNSYARTDINPDPDTVFNSLALEYYSRTDTIGGGQEWGAITIAAIQIIQGRVQAIVNGVLYDCYGSALGRILGTTPLDSLGGHLFNRLSNVRSDVYVNGISVINIVTSQGTRPTHELYLGARNNVGVADAFNTKQCAGAGCLNGLTAAQSLAQYTARQLLNTTLGRNV